MPRLLFIDDDPIILEGFQFIFEGEGFMVDTAQDIEMVLKLIQGNSYKYIILDYIFPDMNGWEMAQRIRDVKSHVNLIFLSGKVTAQDELKKHGISISGFFLKPLKVEDLAEFIKMGL